MVESLNEISLGTLGLLGGLALGALFLVFLGVVLITQERGRIVQTREREVSRREIAAYVAEGSMSAADAAKLLNDRGKSVATPISEAFS